ncbi:MAG: Arginase [Fimbriimonadaceae bacterium]|nr:Arginase [Fimbriimonadaceae bacterium]
MIDIIGVPFDLGGRRTGSRLGPSVLRLADIEGALQRLGIEIRDQGDLSIEPVAADPCGIREFATASVVYAQVKAAVAKSVSEGRTALVLGGDHSLSIGSIAGAMSAAPDLAVLWIDAHGDINSPGTSPSGNLHGMPLGALTGQPSGTTGLTDQQWKELVGLVGDQPLSGDRIAWIGLRDVDPGEAARIHSYPGCFGTTMQDADRYGVAGLLDKFDAWLQDTGSKRLWISFDVDCLDPILAPGTGTAVRGGFTYREGHLVAELLHSILNRPGATCRLAGLDVVEVNPLFDSNNETAKMTVEWVASLFGKSILGRPPQ